MAPFEHLANIVFRRSGNLLFVLDDLVGLGVVMWKWRGGGVTASVGASPLAGLMYCRAAQGLQPSSELNGCPQVRVNWKITVPVKVG